MHLRLKWLWQTQFSKLCYNMKFISGIHIRKFTFRIHIWSSYPRYQHCEHLKLKYVPQLDCRFYQKPFHNSASHRACIILESLYAVTMDKRLDWQLLVTFCKWSLMFLRTLQVIIRMVQIRPKFFECIAHVAVLTMSTWHQGVASSNDIQQWLSRVTISRNCL